MSTRGLGGRYCILWSVVCCGVVWCGQEKENLNTESDERWVGDGCGQRRMCLIVGGGRRGREKERERVIVGNIIMQTLRLWGHLSTCNIRPGHWR